jgi:hypothetical protein
MAADAAKKMTPTPSSRSDPALASDALFMAVDPRI